MPSSLSTEPVRTEGQAVQAALNTLNGSNIRLFVSMFIRRSGEKELCQVTSDDSLVDHMIQAEDKESNEDVSETSAE